MCICLCLYKYILLKIKTHLPIIKLIQYYVKLILFVKANICFYNAKCIKNLPVISLVRVKDVKETKFIVTSAEYETKKLFSFHLKRKWIKRNKKRTWWKIVLYWTGLYKKYTKHDCVKNVLFNDETKFLLFCVMANNSSSSNDFAWNITLRITID